MANIKLDGITITGEVGLISCKLCLRLHCFTLLWIFILLLKITSISVISKVRVQVTQYFTLSSVCSVNREGGKVLSKQLRFYYCNSGFNLLLIRLQVMPLISCLLLHYQLSIKGTNAQNIASEMNLIWHIIIHKDDLGKMNFVTT